MKKRKGCRLFQSLMARCKRKKTIGANSKPEMASIPGMASMSSEELINTPVVTLQQQPVPGSPSASSSISSSSQTSYSKREKFSSPFGRGKRKKSKSQAIVATTSTNIEVIASTSVLSTNMSRAKLEVRPKNRRAPSSSHLRMRHNADVAEDVSQRTVVIHADESGMLQKAHVDTMHTETSRAVENCTQVTAGVCEMAQPPVSLSPPSPPAVDAGENANSLPAIVVDYPGKPINKFVTPVDVHCSVIETPTERHSSLVGKTDVSPSSPASTLPRKGSRRRKRKDLPTTSTENGEALPGSAGNSERIAACLSMDRRSFASDDEQIKSNSLAVDNKGGSTEEMIVSNDGTANAGIVCGTTVDADKAAVNIDNFSKSSPVVCSDNHWPLQPPGESAVITRHPIVLHLSMSGNSEPTTDDAQLVRKRSSLLEKVNWNDVGKPKERSSLDVENTEFGEIFSKVLRQRPGSGVLAAGDAMVTATDIMKDSSTKHASSRKLELITMVPPVTSKPSTILQESSGLHKSALSPSLSEDSACIKQKKKHCEQLVSANDDDELTVVGNMLEALALQKTSHHKGAVDGSISTQVQSAAILDDVVGTKQSKISPSTFGNKMLQPKFSVEQKSLSRDQNLQDVADLNVKTPAVGAKQLQPRISQDQKHVVAERNAEMVSDANAKGHTTVSPKPPQPSRKKKLLVNQNETTPDHDDAMLVRSPDENPPLTSVTNDTTKCPIHLRKPSSDQRVTPAKVILSKDNIVTVVLEDARLSHTSMGQAIDSTANDSILKPLDDDDRMTPRKRSQRRDKQQCVSPGRTSDDIVGDVLLVKRSSWDATDANGIAVESVSRADNKKSSSSDKNDAKTAAVIAVTQSCISLVSDMKPVARKPVSKRVTAKVQPTDGGGGNEEPAWVMAAKRKSREWSGCGIVEDLEKRDSIVRKVSLESTEDDASLQRFGTRGSVRDMVKRLQKQGQSPAS